MDPHKDSLEHPRRLVVGEQVRQGVGDRGPARGPFVQVERDPGRVPEQQADHDRRDQGQDQVGLAEMAALEPFRLLHLADPQGPDHAHEHEHAEDVDEQRVPALVAEPRQRVVLVDDADQRDQDRRKEDREAPEDERVQQPRTEALEQLALPEHDLGLVAGASARTSPVRWVGAAPCTSRTSRRTRVANSVPLTTRAAASASAEISEAIRRPLSCGSRPRSRGRPRAGRRTRRSRRSRRSRPRCRG